MKKIAISLLIAGALIYFWVLFFGGYLNGNPFVPDPLKAKDINPFITALVVPLFTLGSALLVIENLRISTLQNFNNNFFNLLNQHHKIVENINTKVDGIKCNSLKRDFFDDLAWRIATDYYYINLKDTDKLPKGKKSDLEVNDKINVGNTSGAEKLGKIYNYYFHIHLSDLGHYFRNLYHTVNFIDKSSFSKSVKEQNIKILRAQLSNYELVLIGYNGIHEYGAKFYPLIEKYQLLKNINDERNLPETRTQRIIDFEVLKSKYPHLKNL